MAETRTKASVALLVPLMRSRKEDEVRGSASSEVTAAVDASPEVPEIPEVPAVAGPAWRAGAVDDELIALYPDAACALDHDGPFQLLIATVLSAQTTDARVNTVTPELFGRYPDAAALGAARREDLEAILRPLGFQRAKAGHLLGIGQALTERFEGRVPCSREELVSLPGVGRKTANVVLGNAFGKPAIRGHSRREALAPSGVDDVEGPAARGEGHRGPVGAVALDRRLPPAHRARAPGVLGPLAALR